MKEKKHTPSQEEAAKKSEPTSPIEEVIEEEMTTLHERSIAALSYAGPLAIIPFYLKKDSKFCRFHGKQGLLLAIIFFLAQLLTVIDLLMDLFLLLQVGLFFYMGMAALSGRWKKTPFIYKWACQFEETLNLKTKEEEAEEEAVKPGEVHGEVGDEEGEKKADSEKASS